MVFGTEILPPRGACGAFNQAVELVHVPACPAASRGSADPAAVLTSGEGANQFVKYGVRHD